jgi:hypothetical protein
MTPPVGATRVAYQSPTTGRPEGEFSMTDRRSTWWAWLAPLAVIAPLLAVAGTAHAEEEKGAAPHAGASASASAEVHAEKAAEKPAEKAADKPADKAEGTTKGSMEDEDTTIATHEDRKGESLDVGFMVTGVTKIDPVKETFELEGVVTFVGKKVPKCDKAKIGKLFDGEAKKAEMVEENKNADGTLQRQCKVGVEIVGDINVKRYPFDSQVLEFQISDPADALEGLEYHVIKDPTHTGVLDTVRIPGWEVAAFSAESKKSKEEGTGEEDVKAEFRLEVKRPFFASFVKGLLAVIFQLMVTMIAILLPVKNVTNRITMVTGALLAIAATHNTISGSLGVPYLTTADKFFMGCYFSLLVNVMLSVLMLRADNKKDEAKANSLYKTALVAVPVASVITLVVALLPIG